MRYSGAAPETEGGAGVRPWRRMISAIFARSVDQNIPDQQNPGGRKSRW
jgi:hypothetical protein